MTCHEYDPNVGWLVRWGEEMIGGVGWTTCPNCGTRLNADGTVTEMVPKAALEKLAERLTMVEKGCDECYSDPPGCGSPSGERQRRFTLIAKHAAGVIT